MSAKKAWLAAIVLVLLVASVVIVIKDKGGKNLNISDNHPVGFEIISPAFREGAPIPLQYSCKGQNVSPPLNILNVPEKARSLALIMHDPDAPSGDYVHWIMWDIPTMTETIAANSVPVGAIQGRNSAGQNKYMGPCPPSGTHRYNFELYALDKTLGLPAETTRDQLKDSMKEHIIEQHILTGTYSAT